MRLAVVAAQRAAVVLGMRSGSRYEFGSYAPGAVALTFDRAGGTFTLLEDSIAPGIQSGWVTERYLNEAFLSLGGETASIRVGLIDTTFDSLGSARDEESTAHLPSLLLPEGSLFPSSTASKFAVEGTWLLEGATRQSLALEVGPDMSPELLVRTDFTVLETPARVLVRGTAERMAADGRWGRDEANQVVARLVTTRDNYWAYQAGIALQPGPLGLGFLGTSASDGAELSLALRIGTLTDALSAYVVRQYLGMTQDTYQIQRSEIGTVLRIWDPVTIEAAIGTVVVQSQPSYGADNAYIKTRIAWTPSDNSTSIILNTEANTLGGQKGTLKVERTIW